MGNPVGMLKGILQSESAASAAGVRLLDLKRWERNLERSLPESVCVWLTSEAQDVLIKGAMEKKMKNESLSSSTTSDNSTATTGSSIADDEKILPKIKKVRDSDDGGEQK